MASWDSTEMGGGCNEAKKTKGMVEGVIIYIMYIVQSGVITSFVQDKAQSNHATDCDDSLGYEYPFILKVQGDQINMAVFFWYPVKIDWTSVRYFTCEH